MTATAPHRLRIKLERGEPVLGPIVNFDSPWFVDVCGLAGFDFVLIDCEHGPMGPAGIEGMVRAAERAGVSPIVRVPANLPHEILRVLDLGAVGVKVPRVETLADARAVADAARYPPRGTRGLATSTRAAEYGIDTGVRAHVEASNRDVVAIALVETATGVENVDAIAGCDGVDLLAIGPGDLSISMGHGGDRTKPDVLRAIERVIASAKAHGKWCSLPANDPAGAARCFAQGADLVFVGPAAWLVGEGRRFVQEAIRR